MRETVETKNPADERVSIPETAWNGHWRNFHKVNHMEQRLIALGRSDIIEDAEEYADERMKK